MFTILWDFTFADSGGALSSLSDFLNSIDGITKDNKKLRNIVITKVNVPFYQGKAKVIVIPQNKILKRIKYLIFDLNRIIKKEQVDYVIFPGGLPNFIIKKDFAFFVRQALYFCPEIKLCSIPSQTGLILRKLVLKLAAKRATQIFVQTEYMKRNLCERFHISNKVRKVIWNVLTKEELEILRTKKKNRNGKIKLLYVSIPNNRPYKNHINLLKAFNILIREGIDAQLILTCPKPDGHNKRLGKVIAQIHNFVNKDTLLKERVIFTGLLDRRQTLRLYSQADIFVFPSMCESFGVPLLEAMAAGLPIVASDIPVVREVTGNSAFYFDPKKPEDIADKVQQVIQEIEGRAKSSIKTYLQNYHGKSIWKQVIYMLNII